MYAGSNVFNGLIVGHAGNDFGFCKNSTGAADGEFLGRMTGYFAHIFHTDIKNSWVESGKMLKYGMIAAVIAVVCIATIGQALAGVLC